MAYSQEWFPNSDSDSIDSAVFEGSITPMYDQVFGQFEIPRCIKEIIYMSSLEPEDCEFFAAFSYQNRALFSIDEMANVLKACNAYFCYEKMTQIHEEFAWLSEPCSDVRDYTYVYDIITRKVLSLNGKQPSLDPNIIWRLPKSGLDADGGGYYGQLWLSI